MKNGDNNLLRFCIFSSISCNNLHNQPQKDLGIWKKQNQIRKKEQYFVMEERRFQVDFSDFK